MGSGEAGERRELLGLGDSVSLGLGEGEGSELLGVGEGDLLEGLGPEGEGVASSGLGEGEGELRDAGLDSVGLGDLDCLGEGEDLGVGEGVSSSAAAGAGLEGVSSPPGVFLERLFGVLVSPGVLAPAENST